ncbi:hypothetical protein [Kribbella sp. NPDC055071]
MSTSDDIFLAAGESLGATAEWILGALGLEHVGDPELKEDEYLLRGRARTVAGDIVLVVEPNSYGEVDPEPEDVSAIDRYTGVVDVRLVGAKDEESQVREARAVFDELVAARPDVALLLSHAMSWIVAAYLPGVGVNVFPAHTSLDAEHLETWRPWVVT